MAITMSQSPYPKDDHEVVMRDDPEFPKFIRSLFDPTWYLTQNPDVAQAEVDPLEHWLADGFDERRPAGPRLAISYEQPAPQGSWRSFAWRSKTAWVRELEAPNACSVKLFVEPGHYYSPIVDVIGLRDRKQFVRPNASHMYGIDIDYDLMLSKFLRLQNEFQKFEYTVQPSERYRYYSENDFFAPGDALVLFAMITTRRPKRIVEVGSGFSTAVMLDAIDCLEGGFATQLTCIEPYPERLYTVMRDTDRTRVKVREEFVQDVEPGLFANLEAGDILFLDTSHVCKTGSDVNYEIFNILPLLQSGVIVHFHDVFHCFEYPYNWVFDQNRSWNEQYLLRAFLMHNDKYKVVLLNNSIAAEFENHVTSIDSRFLSNSGGSLWLQKLS